MGRKLAWFLMFLLFFSVFKSSGRVWAQSAEDRDWYQKVKVYADLRLRHESYFRDGGTVVDRDRQRIRFRIGATLNISKGLDIGFRLATGGDSPISTNQSFDDAFDTKDFGLDRAFVAYQTGPARLIGGKMANPFYSTEVTWDGDLSFEGLAEQFRFQLADSTKLFINLGQFALDKNATGPVEPFLLAFQAGIEQKFSATVKAKLAVAYYDFLHVKGVALPVGGTVLAEDFDVLDVLGELNFDLGLPVRRPGSGSPRAGSPNASLERTFHGSVEGPLSFWPGHRRSERGSEQNVQVGPVKLPHRPGDLFISVHESAGLVRRRFSRITQQPRQNRQSGLIPG